MIEIFSQVLYFKSSSCVYEEKNLFKKESGKKDKNPKIKDKFQEKRKAYELRSKDSKEAFFYGWHTVKALFKERKSDIIRAYCIEERLKAFGDVLRWCAQNKKAYHVVSEEDLQKITGSVYHEGMAVLAKVKHSLSERELFSKLKTEKAPLVILEGVLNPHNVGSIMRIMAHFGWKYLLCSERYSSSLSGSSARMSEGGCEYVEVVSYKDPFQLVDRLKDLGYQNFGTSTHGRKSLYNLDLSSQPCAFVFGNEVHGLSKEVSKHLDKMVAIPGHGEVQSLNVATASALFVSEYMRQRK